MRRLLFIISLLILAFLPNEAHSTHIVGGEMYYEHLGNNQYQITLYIYRDCINGIPGFDDPGNITVFDSAYNKLQDIQVVPGKADTIPLVNYDTCTWVAEVCYEVSKYEFNLILPPKKGGYYLVYDRCCWNSSVLNVANPMTSGLLVQTRIPDSTLAYQNSSPVFNNRTPPFFCTNRFFSFDHSAIDIDGDSLVYEMYTPLNSSRVNYSHWPPLPGPYNELIYETGYSLSNILASPQPLSIDPIKGELTATLGPAIGQYVFGVKVKEYRDGKLIGESTRAYQMNTQSCNRFTQAKFPNPIKQCGDSIVTFSNNSDSAIAYYWHFGDNNTIDSISFSAQPTHKYSSIGSYQVQLVAHSYQGESCNDTSYGTVYIYPDVDGDFIWEDDECSNFVQFNDATQLTPPNKVVKWSWNFGDRTYAATPNPFHYFELGEKPTSYLVFLKVTDANGCKDSVAMVYTGENRKYRINDVFATKYKVYPRDDSTLLSADADSAVSYSWSPADGVSSPKTSQTYASPTESTTYKVRAKDGRGCIAERTIEIDVHKYACGETVVYVPNAFSPNGDGENDFARIRGEEITSLRFSIYNRWGQMVYESENLRMMEDQTLGWDGSFNGIKQDPGVYVYQLEVQCSDDREFSKKGNITLIR